MVFFDEFFLVLFINFVNVFFVILLFIVYISDFRGFYKSFYLMYFICRYFLYRVNLIKIYFF